MCHCCIVINYRLLELESLHWSSFVYDVLNIQFIDKIMPIDVHYFESDGYIFKQFFSGQSNNWTSKLKICFASFFLVFFLFENIHNLWRKSEVLTRLLQQLSLNPRISYNSYFHYPPPPLSFWTCLWITLTCLAYFRNAIRVHAAPIKTHMYTYLHPCAFTVTVTSLLLIPSPPTLDPLGTPSLFMESSYV